MATKPTPCHPDQLTLLRGIGQPSLGEANRLQESQRSIGDGDRHPTGFERAGDDLANDKHGHKSPSDRGEQPYDFELRRKVRASNKERAIETGSSYRQNKRANIRQEGKCAGRHLQVHHAKRHRRRKDEEHASRSVREAGQQLIGEEDSTLHAVFLGLLELLVTGARRSMVASSSHCAEAASMRTPTTRRSA